MYTQYALLGLPYNGHFWGHMLFKKILGAIYILFGKIRGQFEEFDLGLLLSLSLNFFQKGYTQYVL